MEDQEPQAGGTQQDRTEREAEAEASSPPSGGTDRIEGPRPEPGLTARLDEVTEEERSREPAGMMPGAGPDEESSPRREEIPEELPGEAGR